MPPMSAQERYPTQLRAAELAAERNVTALRQEHPWLERLGEMAHAASAAPGSFVRLQKLWTLANRVNAAILPHTPCKAGCAECCRISVVLSDVEAQAIGKAIGQKPRRVRAQASREQLVRQYFGHACTFLVENQCSIYDNRPLACRAHLSIADSAFFCDTAIPPEDSMVPEVDVMALMHGYASAFQRGIFADIRDFFPPESRKV